MALVDAAGTVHRPAGAEARIVSLVPSLTELICDLGLADRLIGRTGFCVHPRETLKRIPKVGGTKDVRIDEVRVLAPTHVILNVDENEKPTADALAKFVPHLVVTDPRAPEDNLALYRLFGDIFGRERDAEALCARFLQTRDSLERAATHWKRERVLYLIWRDPWMTVARDTYISRTLALARWETQPERAAARYPEIALDAGLLDAVDVVLLSSEPYMFREKHLEEMRGLPELRGKKLALVDGEMTSWYGSRAIAGLEYLARFRAQLDAD
jgi:ABC-type Fe3+-hydroxamate transport system substrate-binding protein